MTFTKTLSEMRTSARRRAQALRTASSHAMNSSSSHDPFALLEQMCAQTTFSGSEASSGYKCFDFMWSIAAVLPSLIARPV